LERKKAPAVDISSSAEALGLLFPVEDWEATPIAVWHFIIEREKTSIEHKKTTAEKELCYPGAYGVRVNGVFFMPSCVVSSVFQSD